VDGIFVPLVGLVVEHPDISPVLGIPGAPMPGKAPAQPLRTTYVLVTLAVT
jgi:hypothetical protein